MPAQMFSLFRVEGHYASVQVIHFPCLSPRQSLSPDVALTTLYLRVTLP